MRNKYKVYIQTKVKPVEYTEYTNNLQLPFTVSERADETYDSATFTLRKLTREAPFNIESKIKIEIFKNNALKTSYVMQIESDNVESFYIGNKKYYNHNISAIELTKKYDNIYLPDFTITNPATKTIVQPYEEVSTDYSLKTNNTGYREEYAIQTYAKCDKKALWMEFYRNVHTLMRSELYLTHIPSFNNGLDKLPNSYYIKGTKIELPVPYCSSEDSAVKFRLDVYYDGYGNGTTNALTPVYSSWDFGATSTHNFENKEVLLEYKYKLDQDSSTYLLGSFKINTETGAINSFESKNNKFTLEDGKIYLDSSFSEIVSQNNINISITMKYIRPDLVTNETAYGFASFSEGVYRAQFSKIWGGVADCSMGGESLRRSINDYYNNNKSLVTEAVQADLDIINSEKYAPFNDEDLTGSLAFLRLFYNYGKDNLDTTITNTYGEINIEDSETIEYSRYEFSNIATLNMSLIIGTTNPSLTEIIIPTEGYKTVQSLLEKINIMMEPEDRFNINYISNDILRTFIPERIYSNRNVSEILFDIGSLVSAYPYLDDNNILRYEKINVKDNILYDDIPTNENVAYAFDNNINTYMTSISNMISPPDTIRKHYSYWPDKRNFAYPNGDWKNNSITPDTNQIEIFNSSGIYFLNYIKVKNCLKTKTDSDGNVLYGPNTVIDITNFCPEETYYNTLYVKDTSEASNTNKSNCIFWTKGSNIINLDALEAQEKTAIFGESAPENYKLQRAVFYAAFSQLSAGLTSIADNVNPNTTEYQFQVCYVDNIQGLVKTKKFNQDVDYEIMSNYNQMDNNINALDWMNTSQINLLRRGNTENNKDVYIRDLNELPVLGELKYNENNEKLFADAIDFNFDNNVVNVKMNYTKNYNKIDPAVSLDKDYRQYEIYGKEAVTRDIRIDRFVYMETDDTIVPENKEEITDSYYNFTGGYRSSERQKTPSYMVLYFKDKDKKPLTYRKLQENGFSPPEEIGGLLIPINITASGNSILMQGGTLDNYAVGYYSDITGEPIDYIDIFGNKKPSGLRRIKEARYVDDLGEAEYVSVYILRENMSSNVFNANIFPKTTTSESSVKLYSYDYEENIHIKKDNREKLNFIYQIHFLTHDKNLKWSPALCKYMFYDQESLNELFRPNDQATSQLSYNASYYNLKYNIGNDALLRYKREIGKDVIDPLYVDFDIRPTSSVDTINQREAVASADYYGYALAYPKTLEVIFHYDKPVKKGETFIKPKISFKFYKNKV